MLRKEEMMEGSCSVDRKSRPLPAAKPDPNDPIASQMERWATALGHHLRVKMLRLFLQHGVCSAKSLADELGFDSNEVAYHVRVLYIDCKLLDFVDSRPARGATEKFYRLKQRSELLIGLLDIPEPIRSDLQGVGLKGFTSSAVGAIEAGTLDGSATGTLDCWVATVDESGATEIRAALAEAGSKIEQVEKKGRERLRRSRAAGVQMVVGLAGFKPVSEQSGNV